MWFDELRFGILFLKSPPESKRLTILVTEGIVGAPKRSIVTVLFWHLRCRRSCFNPAERTKLFIVIFQKVLWKCAVTFGWEQSVCLCSWWHRVDRGMPCLTVHMRLCVCVCTDVSSTCRWKQQAAVQITACYPTLNHAWSCILSVCLTA